MESGDATVTAEFEGRFRARGARGGDRWGGTRDAVAIFGVVAVALVVVVAGSTAWLSRWSGYPVPPLHFPGSGLLEGWVRYDGGWYRDIVAHGYSYAVPGYQANVAFFPGYPMVVWVVTQVIHNIELAGIAVTFLAGLVTAVLFHRWAHDRVDPKTARLAVIALLLYPYAWYLFGAVYADALFLACAVGAFLLVEADHPILAGIVGAMATATRPIGIALVLGLVVLTIERRGGFRHLRALRPADLGVALSATGLVSWSLYQWNHWGDPLLFVNVEGVPGWDQPAGPRTWFKITFLQRLHHLPGWMNDTLHGTTVTSTRPGAEAAYTLSILLQALCVMAAIGLAWVVWRRFGYGYGTYVAAVIAIAALGTKDFLGTGRYLLAAFPLFAALAVVLIDRSAVKIATLGTSAVLLIVLASAYSQGYYVA